MQENPGPTRSGIAAPPFGLPEDRVGIAVTIVLAFAAWHVVAATMIPAFPDEAYYFQWSHHPSIGYYDHPPMVAWWIWLGRTLFGDSNLAGRSLFIAALVADSAVIYLIGRRLFDHLTGLRAAVWLNATFLLGAAGVIALPDGPAILFWSLAVLAVVMVMQSGTGAWWLAVGVFAGLGLVSKYTVLFLGVGIVLTLAVDRDLRRWLASPWLWAGGLVALAVVAPVIVWNLQHDGASLALQFGRIVNSPNFVPRLLLEHILSFFLLPNPLVTVLAGYAVWRWLAADQEHRRAVSLLVLTAAPILVFMTIHALRAQADAHWLVPIYPTLALLAAHGSVGPGRRIPHPRVAGRYVVVVGAAFAVAGGLFLAGPLSQLVPGAAAQFRGWPAFAADVEAKRRETGAGWIGVNDYNYVAEIAHHLGGVVVEQVTERYRYSYRPASDPAVIDGPGLLLVLGEVAPFERCFPGLVPAGEVVHRVNEAPRRRFSAFLIDNAHARVVEGCDADGGR